MVQVIMRLHNYLIFLVNNESSDITPGELIPTLPVFLKDVGCSEDPSEPHDLFNSGETLYKSTAGSPRGFKGPGAHRKNGALSL